MKTAKVLIFATLLVFTSASISNAGGFEKQKKYKLVNVTLIEALGVPGLPPVMLQQLDIEDVLECDCTSFTANVTMGTAIYRITGSRQQWILFFEYGGFLLQEDN